jgi:hypothetical protein
MKSFNDFMKEAWQEGAGKSPVSEKLIGNQKKLDKNKNGKLDADDFKKLRKEEVEQIDELSRDTLKSYVNKREDQLSKIKELPFKKAAHGDKTAMKQLSQHTSTMLAHRKIGKKNANAYYKEETLDEGRVKELAMDLKDMSHDEFHKTYGHPKHHYDPTNFKKPVEPGKGMDRAKALAQRGMQSLSKEEVERIEEKLSQLDELSPATLKSYKKGIYRDLDRAADAYPHGTGDDDEDRKLNNRVKGDELADKKLKAKGVNPYSEEVEQIDELSKKTMGSYTKKAVNDLGDKAHELGQNGEEPDYDDYDDTETHTGALRRGVDNRQKGITRAVNKITKEEVEQIDELSGKTLGSYHQKARKDVRARASDLLWQYGVHHGRDIEDAASEDEWDKDTKADAKKDLAKRKQRDKGIDLAAKKLAKKATANEEVSAEMSPYLKATLSVMDEGKIDNLRDAQKLRQDTQSAYEKDYKPDTSHPHIQVVKGSAYGGANQKDDENDEKPDNETKEKKGRGRPTGSKSGARQKGNGHEDGGIPVHNLHLPNRNK